jgi:glutathione S-transferase
MSLTLHFHPVASYCHKDQEMATRVWAMGDAFTLADYAAAPALFYANEVMPFNESHNNVAAYFGRLKARPSYACSQRG